MFLEHYALGWCTRLSGKYEATSPSWISSPPPPSENPPPLPPSGAPPGSDGNQGGELSATCPHRIRRYDGFGRASIRSKGGAFRSLAADEQALKGEH